MGNKKIIIETVEESIELGTYEYEAKECEKYDGVIKEDYDFEIGIMILGRNGLVLEILPNGEEITHGESSDNSKSILKFKNN